MWVLPDGGFGDVNGSACSGRGGVFLVYHAVKRIRKSFACKRRGVSDRSSPEWTSSQDPQVVCRASLLDDAGLPNGASGFAVVREDSDLRNASLLDLLGQWNFGEQGWHPWHDGRELHLGHAEQHVVLVRSESAASSFDNDVGVFLVFHEPYAVSQQVLPHGADEIAFVRTTAQVLRVKVDISSRQDLEIHVRNGFVDGVRYEELFGRRA